MEEKEIKKIIGKLKYCIDVWKFKCDKANSYIARLEENMQKDFDEKGYEKMKKRDKCLLEEISSFMEVIQNY